MNLDAVREDIRATSEPFGLLAAQLGEVLVGQAALVHRMFIALLTRGHLLIEGVPGLAKTTAVSCLAGGLHASFQRIQFTPDLLPADIVGTLIYTPQQGFSVQKGPIFANIVLADEINRAPAKVQSALLEAMQERQVTIGKETFRLDEPFLVLATQNPIENEGTHALPEAQVDRFLMKVVIDYPTRDEEKLILERMSRTRPRTSVGPVMDAEQLFAARAALDRIYVDPKVSDYIIDLVHATRRPEEFKLRIGPLVQYGSSPRGTIGLSLAAKANAFLAGRAFVVPQDVKDVALDVLRHRLIPSYEAEAEGFGSEALVQQILDGVPVP